MTVEPGKGKRRKTLKQQPLTQAVQGNFDHIMALIRSLSRAHNLMVDDLEALTGGATPTEYHDTSSGSGNSNVEDHADLGGVTANQHHNQSHGNADHTTAFTDDTTVNAHIADTSDAHDASAISADSTTLAGTGTDVQAVLEELDNAIAGSSHDPVTVGTGLDVTGQLVELSLDEVAAGGELGGFLDAPTVDSTHSGSSHAGTQAAAEATAAGALAAHIATENADHGLEHNDLNSVGANDHHAQSHGNSDHTTAFTDDTTVNAHIADGTDAHDASAISILDAANDFTATDVEGALAELQAADEADEAALAAHLADTSDAHDASAISFVPDGSISATDVQAAIVEVRNEAGGGTPPGAYLALYWDLV